MLRQRDVMPRGREREAAMSSPRSRNCRHISLAASGVSAMTTKPEVSWSSLWTWRAAGHLRNVIASEREEVHNVSYLYINLRGLNERVNAY